MLKDDELEIESQDTEDSENEEEQDEEDKQKEIFSDLQFDYKLAKDAKSTIDQLIIEWNDLYYGKKFGNENPQKSEIVMKEIAKQIEWQKPALMEPFTSTSNPIRIKSGKNETRRRIMQKYLNGQFAGEFDREEFMNNLTDVLLREGTVWIRTGWKYLERNKPDIRPNMKMEDLLNEVKEPIDLKQNKNGTFRAKYADEVTVVKNLPTLEVCRNEHIFPDPSARTMDELRFLIYVRYVTISELREAGIYDEDKLELLEGKQSAESREDTGLGQVRDADQRDYGYNATFQTKDTPRNKIKLIEYWGFYDVNGDKLAEPMVAHWADREKINLYLGENPYPSQNIPFDRIVYSARPFSLWGNALAYFLGDNQRVESGIMRGILDNMSLSNNGQKFVERGALDYVNFKRLRNGEKHIIVNKKDAITDGTYNNLPVSIFNTLEMMKKDSEQLSGVNTGSPALGASKLSEDDPKQLTMSQQRMAGTVRNIANVLGNSLKEWLTMAEVFLTNEQIIGMFSEQDAHDIFAFEDAQYVQTSVKVGTEVVRSMRIQQLNMLMQQAKVLGEKTPPDVISYLTAEMFELFDMYEKAEEIRNYKPEPNPQTIKMQELELENKQLENEKLRADIALAYAQAGLDQADAQSTIKYKDAQTAEKYAKTQSHQINSALEPVKVINDAQKNKSKET